MARPFARVVVDDGLTWSLVSFEAFATLFWKPA
jgi:hypothetical protein